MALTFCIMHLLLFFTIFLKVLDNGIVANETSSCYFTWPLMHVCYILQNAFLFWFYLANFYEAKKCDISAILNYKMINSIVMLSATLFLVLKFVSDMNCQIWKVNWSDCLAMVIQTTIECIFINFFYDWLASKICVIKQILTHNI